MRHKNAHIIHGGIEVLLPNKLLLMGSSVMGRILRKLSSAVVVSIALTFAACHSPEHRRDDGQNSMPWQNDEAWRATQERFRTELDRPIEVGETKFKIPGGALAVVIDGRLRYAEGMGELKLHSGKKFEADTLITVASITKMVTAATVMRLVENGLLDLDLPVNQYLAKDGYRLQRRAEDQSLADTITLRQLLDHTSGLPDDLPSGIDEHGPAVCTTDANAFRSYIKLHQQDPLWSKPGEIWNYSNTGYMVAAAAIEAATGQRFESQAEELVLGPAGMATAQWRGELAEGSHSFAYGYEVGTTPGTVPSLLPYSPSSTPCRVFAPAAGLKASVTDFAHFAEAFMAADNGWLSAHTLADLQTPQRHTFDQGWDYSYGFFVDPDYKGLKIIAHDGVAWGYRTVILMIPSRGFAFIGFHNVGLSLPERLWDQAFKAADLFLGLPAGERSKPPIPDGELSDLVGEYRGLTFDYNNYTEADPKYMELTTKITLDDNTHQITWDDSWLGSAVLKPTWWPSFKVNYPDSNNNIEVRFIRGLTGSVDYIVSREYVARRITK